MIEIQHLKKEYEAATPLKDVNTVINKGDVIAVIGPSGTGKSTLLRCLNLLENPTSGKILLDGQDITDPKCDINKVRLKLGMVFQSFNLYEHLTAVENCMIAQTILLKRSKQEAYEKAMELLKSVGLESKALQYPYQLSGGQKQRVAIARTLATDPEIILLDEPTSALDPLTVNEVEDVISELSKQGRTMMIVTHSMDFAKKVANRVFYMDQGEIYEDGTPDQIFNNPQKELTRKFILNLSSVDWTVYDNTHDLEAEVGKIFNFCKSKKIDAKRIMGCCGAYEEYYAVLYRYAFTNNKKLYVRLEYQEKTDKLFISFAPVCKKWEEVEDIVTKSLEYEIFFKYVTPHEELRKYDEKLGTIYTYEVKKEEK